MMFNPHDILLRRKIEEQAELQQVLELQERRLKSLQLPDFKNIPIHHQRSVSVGAPFIFPHQLHSHFNHAGLSPDNIQGDITGWSIYDSLSRSSNQHSYMQFTLLIHFPLQATVSASLLPVLLVVHLSSTRSSFRKKLIHPALMLLLLKVGT